MPGTEHILSILLLLPVVGAAFLALLPNPADKVLKIGTLAITLLTFLVSLLLLPGFEAASAEMQFVEKLPWISAGNFLINYHVGIDGISLWLVILTTLLMPLSVMGSWSIDRNLKSYMVLMLLLEAGMIGVFISLDLVLFYFFWEAMLIPMYFLIGIWGGKRRIYAAVKFFIYTAFGSLIMLAALIALWSYNSMESFDLVQIAGRLAAGDIMLPPMAEFLMFAAFFLAFAIKVPLFPFHTWLPDAHVEAPTAGSVILAGVLLKMGTYGLLRFCLPLFPNASVKLAPLVCLLAIIGIIYGALVAMVQPDVKKLVAYSSVSHLGFVVLGIFSFTFNGLQGATYQMLNHGVSTGALFLLVGILYERRHTRLISEFGGVAHKMPVYSAFFMVILLSSIGLPGLNGFIGEFLILLGTFTVKPYYAVAAASGVILAAVYMLWMYQRVFLGEIDREENNSLQDLNRREIATILPLILLALWMGVSPGGFLRKMDASLQKSLERVEEVRNSRVYMVEDNFFNSDRL